MSNKQVNKNSKNNKNKKVNPLFIATIAVVILAAVVVFYKPNDKKDNSNKAEVVDTTETTAVNDATNDTSSNSDTSTESSETASVPATLNENGDVVIQVSDISETATFYDVEVDGTPMGLFAVKASDGTIRTAFNTCQVCNGSPYAFFEQQGDTFQCQNCGNIYSLDMIGQERGGCNPVPIMDDEKTASDTEILIPASLLKDNAAKFENWKQF
ncbi:MAG: hypothetical protein K0S41_3492 [Anaerocolumna sp.]|jgi:uncharacterized membrane protein|nr:hypothetical protein [Anaerocolumna sp.]